MNGSTRLTRLAMSLFAALLAVSAPVASTQEAAVAAGSDPAPLILFEPVPTEDDPFFENPDQVELVSERLLTATRYMPQTQQSWCWAATSSVVINLVAGDQAKPCELVSEAFNFPCCERPWLCNRTNTLVTMARLIGNRGIEAKMFNGPISWSLMRHELDEGDPVTVGIRGGFGPGHVVNIVGYQILRHRETGDERVYLNVHDPMNGYYEGENGSAGYMLAYDDMRAGNWRDMHILWDSTMLYDPAVGSARRAASPTE